VLDAAWLPPDAHVKATIYAKIQQQLVDGLSDAGQWKPSV
jgi:hypothetical protein